jgi:tetratricopeptide (TPR) repeat protein
VTAAGTQRAAGAMARNLFVIGRRPAPEYLCKETLMRNLFRSLMLGLGLIFSFSASAAGDDVKTLQSRWEVIKYSTPAAEQEKGYAALSDEARAMAARAPNNAEILIWEGIVLSSYAGAKGGLGALSLAKEAKAALEKALEIDDKALSGSAYTSLGALLYQVPGWPIGFGDKDKARAMLQKALTLNPDGMDPNFFYGDFLMRQKDYKGATVALEKARKAPPRPERPLADEGRRKEIDVLLAQVRSASN